MQCPNKSANEWLELVNSIGEAKALSAFHLNKEVIPSLEKAMELLQTPEVKFTLRSVEIANSIPAKREWVKLQNNKISLDQFLLNAQFPKEQKDLIRQVYIDDKPKSLDDLMTGLAARYSYTVEINTTKTAEKARLTIDGGEGFISNGITYVSEQGNYSPEYVRYVNGNREEITKEEFEQAKKNSRVQENTQYYSNLTVPGGTNYTENEIATPDIVPSIKGHAQFSTEHGVGWTRTDEQISYQTIDSVIDTLKQSGRLKVIC